MKKQIFILTFLSLAFLFAGVKVSYGQQIDQHTGPGDGDPSPNYINYLTPTGDIGCAPITDLTCVAQIDALHPQAGLSYTYDVDVTTTGAAIHWFVTDDLNIIEALNNINEATIDPGNGSGSYILEAGTEYNDADNISETISIKWKTFTPPTDGAVLLVTYVVDTEGCTDNIEVYRIEPVFNFTLDIAGLTDAGVVTTSPTECVSPVETAVYDPANNSLNIDYGENWLFFTVTAANFTHSWMPSFQVDYDGTVEDAITVEWAYPADAIANTNWKTTTLDATTSSYESSDAVLHSGTNATNGTVGADDGTGECIVVRVRVDHGPNENPETTDHNLTLAVNGTMYDANATAGAEYDNSLLDDLSNPANAGDDCVQEDYDDEQNYVLTPRPLVETATPASSTDSTIQDFESKNATNP